MLILLEISGLFFLSYRVSYWYASDGEKQFFSEFCQIFGISALLISSFLRIGEASFIVDIIWKFWLMPHWSVALGGGLLGIFLGLISRYKH